MPTHPIRARLSWNGDPGTTSYTAYSRAHTISGDGKVAEIPGSSDPAFRGDASRFTPEELVAAALAACHMLWVLHLAAEHGVVIVAYDDAPEGTLEVTRDGGGQLREVVLRPRIRIARGDPGVLPAVHDAAHRRCFIANSVRFPVRVEPAPVDGP